MKIDVRKVADFSRFQLAREKSLEIIRRNAEYLNGSLPSGSTRDGKYLRKDVNKEWTTGFWTGILALAYEWSSESVFRESFFKIFPTFIDRLEDESRTQTHDLGFLYVLSMGPAKRIFGNKTDEFILKAAEKLIRRFHEKPGYIQAWRGTDDPKERKRVIIDSMMNLPLLYMAWQFSGDKRFKEIAMKHAETCRKYLVRDDFSTYHTYLFNPESGNPIGPETVQGYSNDSYWARGQSWAIYGFLLSYFYTKEEKFLRTAIEAAEFFLKYLPSDLVPYWDMVFGDESGEEKDSSAAAIVSSALFDLSRFVDRDRSAFYQLMAVLILSNLTQKYLNWESKEGGEPILLHGVHAKPLGMGIDEGNIWGDFFYMEALSKLFNAKWKSYWLE